MENGKQLTLTGVAKNFIFCFLKITISLSLVILTELLCWMYIIGLFVVLISENVYIWIPLAIVLGFIPGIIYVRKSFKNRSFIELFIGVGIISIVGGTIFFKLN